MTIRIMEQPILLTQGHVNCQFSMYLEAHRVQGSIHRLHICTGLVQNFVLYFKVQFVQ